MTQAGQNFQVFQGDNHEIVISVVDENGLPANLAGYDAIWCVHQQNHAENIILQKSTSLGGIVISGSDVIISLAQADTATMTPKLYGHQCELEDGSGNHATITTGYMRVLRSITHGEL